MQAGNVLLIDPLFRKAVVGNDLAYFLYNYHLERWRNCVHSPIGNTMNVQDKAS
jgi:hypothetical protein